MTPMIQILTSPDDVRALHAQIITRCFPPHEQGTAEELAKAVVEGRTEILAAREGDRWLACAIGDLYPEVPGVMLFAWLAVAPEGRAGGLGSQVLDTALTRWHATPGSIVLGEVEHVHDGGTEETGDPRRRIEFYRRRGVRVLEVPYFQPPLAPQFPRVPMHLVALPAPGQTVPDELPTSGIRALLENYLDEREGADPEREDVFAALAGPTVQVTELPGQELH